MKAKTILSLCLFFSVTHIFAQTGNWLWGRAGNAGGYVEGFAVCNDRAGNVFATGEFSGNLHFGSFQLNNTGYSDMYVVKYDAAGNIIWVNSTNGTSFEQGFGIAADAQGDVYVVGETQSPTTTFGSYVLTNIGGADIFIAKYDQSGNVVWAKLFGGSGSDEARGVTVDGNGNVYMTGDFMSASLTFGSTTLVNTNYSNYFLTKLDPNGNVLYAKSTSGGNLVYGNSVATDHEGNVFTTGFFGTLSTINFGAITLNTTGSSDIFVAKYDGVGNEVWVRAAGGHNGEDYEGNSISADPAGNVFVGGMFRGDTLFIGPNVFVNADPFQSYYDAFISKYDMNGNLLWAQAAGGPQEDKCYSVSADTLGNAYAVGGFTGSSITWGSTMLSVGPANCAPFNACDPMYLLKLDPNGNIICSGTLNSGGDDQSAVSADLYGNAYFVSDFVANPLVAGPDTLNKSGVEDFLLAKFNCNVDASVHGISIHKNEIKIYPNPANDEVTVQTNTLATQIEICDLQGRIIAAASPNSTITKIQTSDLSEGVYLLRVMTGNTVTTQKLSITR